jgi:hypothetical protein
MKIMCFLFGQNRMKAEALEASARLDRSISNLFAAVEDLKRRNIQAPVSLKKRTD